jgi:hypothetical protein
MLTGWGGVRDEVAPEFSRRAAKSVEDQYRTQDAS